MSETLRPRFRYYVPYSQEVLEDQIKQGLKSNNPHQLGGSILKYHMVLDFPEKTRHFWSPQLDLNIEKYEEGTLIRGLIGPRPNVWTIFMFFNSVAGFFGVIGTIVGMGQWSMENPPYAFWLLPVSAILFGVVYYVGKTGKKIAHPESVQLHDFLVNNLTDYTELQLEDL